MSEYDAVNWKQQFFVILILVVVLFIFGSKARKHATYFKRNSFTIKAVIKGKDCHGTDSPCSFIVEFLVMDTLHTCHCSIVEPYEWFEEGDTVTLNVMNNKYDDCSLKDPR